MFYLMPSNVGGRTGYITKEYTPNAVFGFSPEELPSFWKEGNFKYDLPDNGTLKNSGVILKPQHEITYPGGITLAQMLISKDSENYISKKLLQKDTSFIIREGSRIIGLGKII